MSDLIVKDNALMNASYNLDLVEQRLILLAILEARESGKGINANDPLTVHAESYINQFGVHRTTAYQALKDACKDLFARQFSYQENENVDVQILQVDGYHKLLILMKPQQLRLFLLLRLFHWLQGLRNNSPNTILSKLAVYRVPTLSVCMNYWFVGVPQENPIIELGEFRKRIGVLDTEYQRIERLKHSVLELALKQINEHTDITATYEQHKKGRLITGFSFKFKQKKPKQAEIATETPKTASSDLDTIKPLTEPQIAKYSAILSKLGSLSSLSNFPDYPTFANWLSSILRDPKIVIKQRLNKCLKR